MNNSWNKFKYVHFEIDDASILVLLIHCRINYKVKFLDDDIRVTIKLDGLTGSKKILLQSMFIKEEIYAISFIS
jgi:hypothetical protein